MKKRANKAGLLLILLNLIFPLLLLSQNLAQTVRGKVYDIDNNIPLIGATVRISNTNPLKAVVTDVNGNFRLEGISAGRITLHVSYIGYEGITIPNIVVNSGKEVVLDIPLQESVIAMDEVVVKATKNKGEAINDMTLLSARSVSFEETNRYAGAFNDPSRMLTNFAGVTTQSGNNNIIVRGNSPKYVQWRLEGVEITNPNHFEDQNSSSSGMNALNNSLLAASDFYTGAFSSEYGDVLSGIYDVKLRSGNNETFESTFGFGLIGTDFTIEGPFKKGYRGSYIANYRYSTGSIISDIGLVDFGGVPRYQDATFKIVLPTKKMGAFSIHGLSGLSSFIFNDIEPDFMATPGDNNATAETIKDFDKKCYLANYGITHTMPINSKSYIKTILSFSGNGSQERVYESQINRTGTGAEAFLDTTDRLLNFKGDINTLIYRGAITYNNKINAKNRLQVGAKYTLTNFNIEQSQLGNDSSRITLVDNRGDINTIRSFATWKCRFNDRIEMVAGLHNMNVLLNSKSTIEPRIAFRMALNSNNSLHVGYGKHSVMERIHNYYSQVKQDDGTIIEPNHDLDLLKAHHFVLGYQLRFSEYLMAKIEAYYQDLYDLPVENIDSSVYSTINEGTNYRYVDLVNEGTGRNYGVELTVEKFFHNNYYFLINASLFDSKYKTLEGVLRNTEFNSNYIVNVLAGKEFNNLGRKRNQIFSLNTKFYFGGGLRYVPLLRNEEGNIAVDPANNQHFDYNKAYNNKLDNILYLTVSLSYKWNKPKTTHELFLSVENITNNAARMSEYYDPGKPDLIGYKTQTPLFPNFMYRVYF